MLVDWGLARDIRAVSIKPKGFVSGTPLTMSQRSLAFLMKEQPATCTADILKQSRVDLGAAYTYTIADELESAAKSVLLILSPALKRTIRHQISNKAKGISSAAVLWECWHDVLSKDLRELCQSHSYSGIADWLTSNDRLLLYQPRA